MKNKLFTVLGFVVLGVAVVAGSAFATTVGTNIILAPVLDGSSSAQSVEADAEFDAFTGGYGAGVMGHAFGDIGTGDSIIAGIIGKYNIADGTDSDHPQAGVVGEVGEDSAGTADAAFLAVLGGDSGALDAGAAYGVRYLNSTAGSQFDYGIDLFSGAIDSYQAVSYGTADVRLQNGEIITNAVDGTVRIGGAAGNTLDIGSAASNASIRSGTAVPSSCSSGDIFIDIDADPTALFVCDGNEDGDGEFDPVTITD